MFSIRGDVKDYDWGILDGLTPWTQASTGAPQAELWFGVHPSGPSPMDAAYAIVQRGSTSTVPLGVLTPTIPTGTAIARR